MTAQIRIEGIEELEAKLGELATIKVLRPPMEESLAHLRNEIATYPPPPSGYRMVWKSEKQRRFFFAALREGLIQVPYRRTGTLGRSWTHKIDVGGSTLIKGVLGNNVEYGPWVQGEGQQAAIHVNRWRTDAQVAKEQESKVVGIFDMAIQKAMP